MKAQSDEGFINRHPDDAADMADLVRRADRETAVALMQVWGSKQRDIGALKAIEICKRAVINA